VRTAHLFEAKAFNTPTFKSWSVKETVVGQFALEHLNNYSLHAGHTNYLLHKTIANKLNRAETMTSA